MSSSYSFYPHSLLQTLGSPSRAKPGQDRFRTLDSCAGLRADGGSQIFSAADEGLFERSLRSQAVVSLDSICHLRPGLKTEIAKRIESKVRRKDLVIQRKRLKGLEEELPRFAQFQLAKEPGLSS